MSESQNRSVWASGAAYEPYIGRWSRPVAREFLTWLAAPQSARWLDIGCGTGALSETILAQTSPAAVHGIEPSEGYWALAREQVRDPRVHFELGDARRLPVANAAYDVVVSGLVLNFIPAIRAGLAEMVRVTKPGGTVAAYVWDYAGKMELMRYFWDAAVALKPEARERDEGRRFPICQPIHSALFLERQDSNTSQCKPSTCLRTFATLRITGHHSWAGNFRPPIMRCH
jgi:SAM-dependent methyltransferase